MWSSAIHDDAKVGFNRGQNGVTEMTIAIRPADSAPLFGGDLGGVFLLVTSPAIRNLLSIEEDSHCAVSEYSWTGPQAREGLIATFEGHRRAQRLVTSIWIAEDEFEHYAPEQLVG